MSEGAIDTRDLYAELGVDAGATADEIRVAYRGLAHRFHPDHNPENMSAARRMQEINEAFAVLNSPERRRAYDRRRATAPPSAATAIDPRGAGRGPRPYYRGKNWGLHAGADAPPEHIVRVSPAGFNLVVTRPGECPSREVTVHSDAPFPVRMRVICSPWLVASAEELSVAGGGSTPLAIAIRPEASHDLRGWRDGGISLDTDDPRIFCPDIRITAIFLQRNATAGAAKAQTSACEPDPRPEASPARERRPWLRRLFERRT